MMNRCKNSRGARKTPEADAPVPQACLLNLCIFFPPILYRNSVAILGPIPLDPIPFSVRSGAAAPGGATVVVKAARPRAHPSPRKYGPWPKWAHMALFLRA